jgi:glycosyl hydrolase family 44
MALKRETMPSGFRCRQRNFEIHKSTDRGQQPQRREYREQLDIRATVGAGHGQSMWGPASNAAPRYYVLDNEPSIWHSTHRDVHPTGATMDEVRNRILDYAEQIRAADPGAKIVGPEEWGWSGYFYSGYDQQYGSQHGWGSLPDRNNHGGADYLPWLLGQLKADGRHLLDVFTVHYYPQGGEFGNDTSTSMQLLRNRSTRSLWDPTYVDPTWITTR